MNVINKGRNCNHEERYMLFLRRVDAMQLISYKRQFNEVMVIFPMRNCYKWKGLLAPFTYAVNAMKTIVSQFYSK